jgi:hypothetical protein
MSLDPITAGFDLVKTGLDKFFPDADLELKGKLEAAATEINNNYQLQLVQIEVNKVEAGSSSLFTSGWRPFIGWICGFALAYCSILEPLLRFIANVLFGYAGTFPAIDTDITMQVLLGILGLGAMRSYDKVQGTVRK